MVVPTEMRKRLVHLQTDLLANSAKGRRVADFRPTWKLFVNLAQFNETLTEYLLCSRSNALNWLYY